MSTRDQNNSSFGQSWNRTYQIALDLILIALCNHAVHGSLFRINNTSSNLKEDSQVAYVSTNSDVPYTIEPNECLYVTPKERYKILEKSAFEEMCHPGSEVYNHACQKEGISQHMCKKCSDGQKLPNLCFCDKDVQCRDHRSDKPRKYNCSDCRADLENSRFSKRLKNDTSCEKIMDRKPIDNPSCRDGYNGTMCVVITKRICTQELTDIKLPMCSDSNDDKCKVVGNLNTTWICKVFEGHVDEKRSESLSICGVSKNKISLSTNLGIQLNKYSVTLVLEMALFLLFFF